MCSLTHVTRSILFVCLQYVFRRREWIDPPHSFVASLASNYERPAPPGVSSERTVFAVCMYVFGVWWMVQSPPSPSTNVCLGHVWVHHTCLWWAAGGRRLGPHPSILLVCTSFCFPLRRGCFVLSVCLPTIPTIPHQYHHHTHTSMYTMEGNPRKP